MTAARRRVLSLAAVAGMAGGSIAGLVAGEGTAPAAAETTQQAAAAPTTSSLAAQVKALLQQERALRRALTHAQAQLDRKVSSSEASLTALRGRLAATQDLLRREQAALASLRAAPVRTESGRELEVEDDHGGDRVELEDSEHHEDDGGDDHGDDDHGGDHGGDDDD